MKGMLKFNKGLLGLPVSLKLWILSLVAVNLFAPLLFITHREAQVTIVVFLISGLLMGLLTGKFGFTRILGLGHILWIPMLA